MATFNAGLAPNFVPYTDERRDAVVDAIASVDAELVCLQEIWLDEDIAAITAAAADRFPYNHMVKTTAEDTGGGAACTVEETDPLVACATKYCDGAADLVGCVLGNCGTEFNALSDDCKECAAANVGLPDIDAIVDACTSGGGSFSWGGHNGLLLLSREALADVDMLELESWLVQRAALYARVGDLHVGCTHLAAELNEPEYNSDFAASYAEEQAQQFAAVSAWMLDKAGSGPVVLLGDFNTGPAKGALTGELPENWPRIEDAGWSDPNVAQDSPFCTWCGAANNLISDDKSNALDHVLTQGATATDAQRILDASVTIQTSDGALESALSDHFGMAATVQY